jgi:hypothetical protein
MKYDGVVIRLNELFLFIYDPDEKIIKDGINISDHECYKDLKDDHLMVVNVIFKDGTKDIEKINLDEFIYGDSYGRHDVFIYISDVMLFTMNEKKYISDVIEKGELNKLVLECIAHSKNEIKK